MYKLGILGCGNMGKAYVLSLITNKVFAPSQIIVCNRTETKNILLQQEFGVHTTTNPHDLESVDTIIIGIKPQGLDALHFFPKEKALIISLLVGTTINTLQKKFGSATIVRFMPNIGQYFGLGVTGVFSDSVEPNSLLYKKIDQIASAGSTAIWLDTEDGINHIAAISGSGPAYFFAFAESLQQAAQRLGFDNQTSQNLVVQTLLGTAEYVKQHRQNISLEADTNQAAGLFGRCINTVASKGGTTQEALKTLREQNLNDLVQLSAQAAVDRGNQLAAK